MLRCWSQQSGTPRYTGTSSVPAPALVPEMLRHLTGADLCKDPSPPEAGQGWGWLVLHDRKIKFELGGDP